jgi:hypothetical protein
MLAARTAGKNPPMTPMTNAKTIPFTSSSVVILNAKATCENVCKFMAPVVRPFRGSTTMQPTNPPTKAMSKASMTNENTTDGPPNPSARIVAISRPRSATAEYMVLSAPKTAPIAITPATRPPSTVISVVKRFDCFE